MPQEILERGQIRIGIEEQETVTPVLWAEYSLRFWMPRTDSGFPVQRPWSTKKICLALTRSLRFQYSTRAR